MVTAVGSGKPIRPKPTHLPFDFISSIIVVAGNNTLCTEAVMWTHTHFSAFQRNLNFVRRHNGIRGLPTSAVRVCGTPFPLVRYGKPNCSIADGATIVGLLVGSSLLWVNIFTPLVG